jgi:serine protease DegQ
LVDARGVLVGINTAIFSPGGGGSVGIGFAVPADTAREVLQAIVGEGRVVRGWIGVEPRDLSPELVESLKLGDARGVLVTGVLQDGPAAQAGLKPGDVITAVGVQPITDSAALLRSVAALKPQSTVDVQVRRGGQPLTLALQVARRPPRGG